MSDRLVKRIYVGNLSPGVEERDIQREFERCGKISKLDLKRTVSGLHFAFIEYYDPRDAEDALKEMNGILFNGSRLRVEIPFKDREGGRSRNWRGRGLPPRKGKYVVEVLGLPPSGSWQDLKDHMREVGECGHADVFKDGVGEVSFFSRRDMEAAVDRFNGSSFRSHEGEKTRITVREKAGYLDDRNGYYPSRSRSRSYDGRRDSRDYYESRNDRRYYSRDYYDDRRRSYSRSYDRHDRDRRGRSRSRTRSRTYDD